MKTVEEFISCSCMMEGVYVVKHKEDKETYLAFFKHGINPKRMSLWQKIRYIWHVIATGKPFEDEVVLSQKGLVDLINALNKCIDGRKSSSKSNSKSRL
jgi:hypothetical protein